MKERSTTITVYINESRYDSHYHERIRNINVNKKITFYPTYRKIHTKSVDIYIRNCFMDKFIKRIRKPFKKNNTNSKLFSI